MNRETLNCLIPAPRRITPDGKRLPVDRIQTVSFPPEAVETTEDLLRVFNHFKKNLSHVPENGNVEFICDSSLLPESWKIVLSPEKIIVLSADRNGFRYAANALKQMLFIALCRGPLHAELDCGVVEDSPRFGMRSFMLDSARHFQSPDMVKQVISLLAEFRINTFHWHLADNQSWRIESALTPGIAGYGELDDGFYSRDEIVSITTFARGLGIRVIPEIDFPGHSKRLLSLHPEFACDSSSPGREICIGNPKSRVFCKKILDEIMELFPDSQMIHLGGDEANMDHWEKCSVCRDALQKKNLSTFRELENDFMKELADYTISKGRIPILWATCSDQKYPQMTVQQLWLDKLTELKRIASNGNHIIFSLHNSLYFDYPADLSEPHENWMFELSERGVYMTEPYILWEKELKDLLLGPEACLWTEYVPEWRIFQKILPRLPAYAEMTWTLPHLKEYNDFIRRKNNLKSAGYFDFLRNNMLIKNDRRS